MRESFLSLDKSKNGVCWVSWFESSAGVRIAPKFALTFQCRCSQCPKLTEKPERARAQQSSFIGATHLYLDYASAIFPKNRRLGLKLARTDVKLEESRGT
jgi:hypothetical protein